MKITGIHGAEKLKKVLDADGQKALDRVVTVSIAQMRNRAVKGSDPVMGGTPFITGELRQSTAFTENKFGYTKEYAPHVEYGHRTRSGGFAEGRKFLKHNRDIQEPLYIKAAGAAIGKLIGK